MKQLGAFLIYQLIIKGLRIKWWGNADQVAAFMQLTEVVGKTDFDRTMIQTDM